jgi:hypothetical protein
MTATFSFLIAGGFIHLFVLNVTCNRIRKTTKHNVSGLQTKKLIFYSKIRFAYFSSVRNLFITQFCRTWISITVAYMRQDVLSFVMRNIQIFWNMTSSLSVRIYRLFGRAYSLNFHGTPRRMAWIS